MSTQEVPRTPYAYAILKIMWKKKSIASLVLLFLDDAVLINISIMCMATKFYSTVY